MLKDFDTWNIRKKSIHIQTIEPFYKEREIWWCSLGINIGSEQDGTGINFDRPIVVVKGFNRQIFFGVALTGRIKEGKYYTYLGKICGRDASAILSQVKVVDTKRLIRKLGTLDRVLFEKLERDLKKALFS